MPGVKEPEFEDDIPRFRDLPEGTKLKILKLEFSKTKTKQYPCVTATLVDGSQLFGTDKMVVTSLEQASEEYGLEFKESDPLTATVSKYTDSFGNQRTSLSP